MGRKIDVLSGSLEAEKSGFSTTVTASGAVAVPRPSVLQQLGGSSHPHPLAPEAPKPALPLAVVSVLLWWFAHMYS